jgi:hypothetical protein
MTIKEKCISIKNKIVDFWKEHKAEIIIAGVAIGGVTVACIAAAKSDYDYQEDLDYDYTEDYRQPDEPESTCECDSVFTDDFCTRNWNDELYRENWDKVNEFAKTMKLHKGESYILDDSQQFYDQPWYDDEKDGHVIVSHMLNGDGCYPPENKEEEVA